MVYLFIIEVADMLKKEGNDAVKEEVEKLEVDSGVQRKIMDQAESSSSSDDESVGTNGTYTFTCTHIMIVYLLHDCTSHTISKEAKKVPVRAHLPPLPQLVQIYRNREKSGG